MQDKIQEIEELIYAERERGTRFLDIVNKLQKTFGTDIPSKDDVYLNDEDKKLYRIVGLGQLETEYAIATSINPLKIPADIEEFVYVVFRQTACSEFLITPLQEFLSNFTRQ